jgi:DNA-binding NtrC family response regulator
MSDRALDLAWTHSQVTLRQLNATEAEAQLYARLAGAVLRIPALRDRLEDVGIIVASLLHKLAPERFEAIGFSSSAARAILGYEWPRNVRELEKCSNCASSRKRESSQIEHLPEAVQRADLSARRSQVATVNVLAPKTGEARRAHYASSRSTTTTSVR